MTIVDYLFQEFLHIWDWEWGSKLGTVADGKKQKWAAALCEYRLVEVKEAVNEAARIYDKPPSIAKFRELCSKFKNSIRQNYLTSDNRISLQTENEKRRCDVMALIKKVHYPDIGWGMSVTYDVAALFKSYETVVKQSDPKADEFKIYAMIEGALREKLKNVSTD